ncbi:hypothetical protein [Nocardia yamanashiensis]|uniref:hypothetical protein n=1 Tax=Nocardia yamanashiensis TaxID=209247 RepID=UPI001C3FC1D5|nr:hypothetical protein [Nocardia yamanashiensis]
MAYEAAVEAINKAVGAYSALIADHEAAPEPDTAAISQILAAQHELARQREQLDPTDHAQIARTRQEMTALVEQLRTQRR